MVKDVKEKCYKTEQLIAWQYLFYDVSLSSFKKMQLEGNNIFLQKPEPPF